MSADLRVTGNVLSDVDKKIVVVGGEQVPIFKFSMKVDAFKREGDKFVADKEKEFDLRVTVWNARLGEQLLALIRPGMKVDAFGSFQISRWTSEIQNKSGINFNLTAESVALNLVRVESIVMRPTRRQIEEAQLVESAESRALNEADGALADPV
jgi:single-strand DNA-binding protein